MVPVPAGQTNRRCFCILSYCLAGRSLNSHLMRKKERRQVIRSYHGQCVNTLSRASSNKQHQILRLEASCILTSDLYMFVMCVSTAVLVYVQTDGPLEQHLVSSLCPIIVSQVWRRRSAAEKIRNTPL